MAALLLALAVSGCTSQSTPPSALATAPGSLTVHMGGSFTSFAGAGSAH